MPPVNTVAERRSGRIRERSTQNVVHRRRDRAPSRQGSRSSRVSSTASINVQSDEPLTTKIDSLTTSISAMQKQMDEMTKRLNDQSGHRAVTVPITSSSNSIQTLLNAFQNIQATNQNITVPAQSTDKDAGVASSNQDIPVVGGMMDLSGNDSTVSSLNEVSNSLQQILPLGSNVNSIIKNKIWANEFVELGTLLSSNDKSQAKQLIVENNKLAFVDNSKHIKTIDQWVPAFTVFITIYCEKYSGSYKDLLKYMDIVRDMARRRGNWYQYDVDFRKSKCQLNVTWGNMHHQLWLSHMVPDENRASANTMAKVTSTFSHASMSVPRIPTGYCVKFHTGNNCKLPCRYNHRCFVCNLLHSVTQCRYNQNNDTYGDKSNFRAQSANSIRPPFQNRTPRFSAPRFTNPPRFNRR